MSAKWLAGGLLVQWTVLLTSTAQQVHTVGLLDICQTEELHVACAPDEVSIIRRAAYGRMRIGRCVATNYGSVGCQVNVTSVLEERCSGRRECWVRVPDAELDDLSECPPEFKTYLEVTYDCLQVAWTPERDVCPTPENRTLTSDVGYISNLLTVETAMVGGYTCPWYLQAQPGQHIVVTLLDFSRPLASQPAHGVCHQYAIIREEEPTVNSVKVCGSDVLSRIVFMSSGHQVNIRILTSTPPDQQEPPLYFLLKYEVLGCPVLGPPSAGWVEQDGLLALLHCNHSYDSWRLECQGRTWVGPRNNCTESVMTTSAPPDEMSLIIWGDLALPYSVCIAIIVGLAIIVATVIMLVGLMCLEWRRVRLRRDPDSSPCSGGPARDSMFVYGPGEDGDFSCRTVCNTLPAGDKRSSTNGSFNTNQCSWPRTKHVTKTALSLQNGTTLDDMWAQPDTRLPAEHIYECPALTQYGEVLEGPHYFQLEHTSIPYQAHLARMQRPRPSQDSQPRNG